MPACPCLQESEGAPSSPPLRLRALWSLMPITSGNCGLQQHSLLLFSEFLRSGVLMLLQERVQQCEKAKSELMLQQALMQQSTGLGAGPSHLLANAHLFQPSHLGAGIVQGVAVGMPAMKVPFQLWCRLAAEVKHYKGTCFSWPCGTWQLARHSVINFLQPSAVSVVAFFWQKALLRQ